MRKIGPLILRAFLLASGLIVTADALLLLRHGERPAPVLLALLAVYATLLLAAHAL